VCCVCVGVCGGVCVCVCDIFCPICEIFFFSFAASHFRSTNVLHNMAEPPFGPWGVGILAHTSHNTHTHNKGAQPPPPPPLKSLTNPNSHNRCPDRRKNMRDRSKKQRGGAASIAANLARQRWRRRETSWVVGGPGPPFKNHVFPCACGVRW